MTEISKFEMYQMQFGICNIIDEVDKIVNQLKRIDEYSELEKFLDENFDDLNQDVTTLKYPKIHKCLYISTKEDAIEIFAEKNGNDFYFSKGWRKPEN